jgi:hypothetical protein
MTQPKKYTATAPASPVTKPDPKRRVRKIGQRDETITVEVSPAELDRGRRRIVELMADEDHADDALADVKAQFKARIQAIRLERSTLRRIDASGKKSVDVTIEEWLTASNEVIRVRTDTQEQVGARTASSSELQEPLFPADTEASQEEDEPESDLDTQDDFGSQPH